MMQLRHIKPLFRREFAGYFATPLAVVFLVIFLSLSAALPLYVGGFFERDQADLMPFFEFHPWLYMVLVPAIGMRLWAEERKSGTLELLLTLPVTIGEAVLAKFLAGWAFLTLALALTFPMWITVNYLGHPDNGVILSGYFGSFLLAGALLAIASCFSALTRNQVIAFVLAVVASFLALLSGLDLVLNFFRAWAPRFVVDLVSSLSLLTHFDTLTKGLVDLRGLVFFGSTMVLGLYATVLILTMRRGR
jgi:ABC-2 type transport system permease protein